MLGTSFIHQDVPATVPTTGTRGGRYILPSGSSDRGGGTGQQAPSSSPRMRAGGPAAQGGTERSAELRRGLGSGRLPGVR